MAIQKRVSSWSFQKRFRNILYDIFLSVRSIDYVQLPFFEIQFYYFKAQYQQKHESKEKAGSEASIKEPPTAHNKDTISCWSSRHSMVMLEKW